MTFINILLTSTVLIVIPLLILLLKSLNEYRKYRHVPGPEPIPILGNVLLFMKHYASVPVSKMLTKVFRELRETYKEEGMFKFFYGSKLAIYVFKPQVVTEFLKDNTLINKPDEYKLVTPWLGEGLITSNGSKWKRKRKMLNPTFHSKILEAYISVINEESEKFVKSLRMSSTQGFIDVRSLISDLTLNIISLTAMGVQLDKMSEKVAKFIDSLHSVPSNLTTRLYNPLYWNDFLFNHSIIGRQVAREIKFLHQFTDEIIQERKATFKPQTEFNTTKYEAFLDLLLTAQSEDCSITDKDIREDVDTFMFAGHDTSAGCLMFCLFLLGLHKEKQLKLREEMNSIFGNDINRPVNQDDLSKMNYTECVLKETLRIYPSAPIIGRVADKEVILGKYKFPKGTSIFVSIVDVHKDEATFEKPNEFTPERFLDKTKINVGFIPFAIGPRNCIGQRFAMMEMKIILAIIFRQFSVESDGKEDDIDISSDAVLKPMSPLNVAFREDDSFTRL